MCAVAPATAKHNKLPLGPTSYAAHRIQQNSVVSFFRIIFNEPMLKNVRKCTITEAQRVTINDKWSVSLYDLDKVIGVIIARDVNDGCLLPIKSMGLLSRGLICLVKLYHAVNFWK